MICAVLLTTSCVLPIGDPLTEEFDARLALHRDGEQVAGEFVTCPGEGIARIVYRAYESPEDPIGVVAWEVERSPGTSTEIEMTPFVVGDVPQGFEEVVRKEELLSRGTGLIAIHLASGSSAGESFDSKSVLPTGDQRFSNGESISLADFMERAQESCK